MPQPPSASRPSAPVVQPIEHDGVRYREDETDERNGDQDGGYLAAFDIATGNRLWRLKVYPVSRGGPPGAPKGSIHFRAMTLEQGGTVLRIENEAGGIYQVELKSRTAQQVGGPEEQ